MHKAPHEPQLKQQQSVTPQELAQSAVHIPTQNVAPGQDLTQPPVQAQVPPHVPMHAPAATHQNVIQQLVEAIQALGNEERRPH